MPVEKINSDSWRRQDNVYLTKLIWKVIYNTTDPLWLDKENINYLNFMSIQKLKKFKFCLKLKCNYYFIFISIHIWNKFLKVREGNIGEIRVMLRCQKLVSQCLWKSLIVVIVEGDKIV